MCSLEAEIMQINRLTSERLFKLKTTNSLDPTIFDSRLVFPNYRNGKIRISEQEARFAFVSVLECWNRYFYSVETPTFSVHSFSGLGMRSALFDLCLYKQNMNGLKLVTACEFKHGVKGIHKDIQKLASLTSSEAICNWFQLIGSIDSGTINPLYGTIANALKASKPVHSNAMIFHFCILSPEPVFLQKVLDTSESSLPYDTFVDDFFKIDYTVRAGKLLIKDANGWI